MLCLYLKWRKLKHWWNRLQADIQAERPIDWSLRINQLLKIINEMLDAKGVQKHDPEPISPPPSKADEPSPSDRKVGPLRRLLRRRRKRD